ncbi:MAG: hypothetical protein AcusKO_51130 [Acuticoccus sp.]
MASERASAFEDDGDIDLSGFAPKAQRDKGVPSDKVKALAQQSKFRERDMPQPTGEGARPPRRYRTGRNRQINIKASDATIQSLYTIADAQGWVLGETLEHALAALERELAKR